MTTTAVPVDQLTVQTPEAVQFRIPLAGPATRMLALEIDVLVVAAITGTIQKILSPFVAFDIVAGLIIVMGFVVYVGYGIGCEWFWRGQTVGKKLMRLRVVDMEGRRLEPAQIVIRNLLRFVDGLPLFYLLGGIVCLVNKNRQRLGDIAARTVVIRHQDVWEPDLDQILGAKYNSFLEHRRLAARLRDRVPPALAGIALEALLRRDQLDPAARLEIFGDLANRLRALVEFPADATELLSDEQYVRNAVEILFRAPR